jgi:hypothetical protein
VGRARGRASCFFEEEADASQDASVSGDEDGDGDDDDEGGNLGGFIVDTQAVTPCTAKTAGSQEGGGSARWWTPYDILENVGVWFEIAVSRVFGQSIQIHSFSVCLFVYLFICLLIYLLFNCSLLFILCYFTQQLGRRIFISQFIPYVIDYVHIFVLLFDCYFLSSFVSLFVIIYFS